MKFFLNSSNLFWFDLIFLDLESFCSFSFLSVYFLGITVFHTFQPELGNSYMGYSCYRERMLLRGWQFWSVKIYIYTGKQSLFYDNTQYVLTVVKSGALAVGVGDIVTIYSWRKLVDWKNVRRRPEALTASGHIK